MTTFSDSAYAFQVERSEAYGFNNAATGGRARALPIDAGAAAPAGAAFEAGGYSAGAPRRGALRLGRELFALLGGLVLAALLIPLVAGAAPFSRTEGPRLSRYYGGVAGVVSPAGDAQPAQEAQPAEAPREIESPAEPQPPAPALDRPAVARHAEDYDVAAPPSVSAATIDRVLEQYDSPAQGLGAVFYDLGVGYGIDPAYALAFYIHESQAGTKGVARFTKSIGNIRTTPGYRDYEGYRAYDSYEAGIEDFYKLIRELYVDDWGLTTPDAILLRYAPWGDNNNPVAYAENVRYLVNSWQEK